MQPATEKLLNWVKEKAEFRGDDKIYVARDEIIDLIENGGEVLLNRPQMGGLYVIVVKDGGFLFVHVTSSPIPTNSIIAANYPPGTSIH